jgi:hypothetical protein
MQPRADAAVSLQRLGTSSEDEEDRLERIFGVGSVTKHSQAGSVHEGAMAVDEGRKGIFVAVAQESGETASIGVALARPRPALEDLHQCCFEHRWTHAR